jgi:O-antigen/teichoic acid export membrane protein
MVESPPTGKRAAHSRPARSGPWARLKPHLGDRTYMGVSVLVRMAVGLAVFVLLARGLGPAEYGLFSTVFAYAAIGGFLTDFGYAVRSLRDIAAAPERGGQALADGLSVKALLTVTVMTLAVLLVLFLPITASAKTACILIVGAVLATSVGDLALVGFRSLGRYSTETGMVLWTSALHGLILSALALSGLGIVAVSAGFLISRLIYMAAALLGVRRLFESQPLRRPGLLSTIRSLRTSTSWALDSGLGYLSTQIDLLIIAHMLGLSPAGIYHSGGRFVQSALGLGAILSNVHIPRLAGAAGGRERGRHEWRVMAEFLGLGLGFAAALLLAGPLITRYLLGPNYAEANRLWPGFAAFLLARYAAAGVGSVLSARAKPTFRVAAQIISLTAIVAGLVLALPKVGLVAGPWIMAAGSAMTAVIYLCGYLAFRTERTSQ